MKNLKNTILNGKLSDVSVSEKTGKTYIKVSFFDKWIKNPLTGEMLTAGKKQTVKLYEGGRGYADALKALELNKDVFSLVGCLISFNIQGDNDIVKHNRLILEEDEADLEEIYLEEKSYWAEQGLLVLPKSDSKEEDLVISQAKLAEAEAAAKLLAEAAGQE